MAMPATPPSDDDALAASASRRTFLRAAGAAALGATLPSPAAAWVRPRTARADLVIRGGTVFDGTGAEGRELDVALSGGRIETIGRRLAAGAEEIDARGLAVAPGFV